MSAVIPLWARGGAVRAWVTVDRADFDMLVQWRWSFGCGGYAYRGVRVQGCVRKVLMHRQLLGLEHGDKRQGEHENRDKLDCRRSNLRIAVRGQLDNQQNRGVGIANTSGFRGVSWDKTRGRWRAYAQADSCAVWLGRYDTAEEADVAIKAWRAEHMPFSQEALCQL